MGYLKYILFLTILATLVGCGAKDDKISESGSGNASGNTAFETDLLKDEGVRCPYSDCPGYLAKIVSLNSGKAKHCTGFLTEDNAIITSASCLDKSIRASGSDCSRRVFVIFPETKIYGAQVAGCSTVENVSSFNDSAHPAIQNQNFAKIRLTNSMSREVVKMSNKGVFETKKYYTWKVSSEENNIKFSRLNRYDCNPIFNSYANPFANSKNSSQVLFGKCTYLNEYGQTEDEVIQLMGSEGAPIFDGETASVVAITGVDAVSKNESENINNMDLVHKNHKLNPMKLATNVSCIEEFSGAKSVPDRCFETYTDNELEIKREEILATTDKAIGISEAKMELVSRSAPEPTSKIKWKVTFSEIDIEKKKITPIYFPECIYNPDNWLKEFKTFFNLIYEASANTYDSISDKDIVIKLNSVLKAEAKMVTYDKQKTDYPLHIKPRKIHKKKPSNIRVTNPQGNIFEIKDVKVCE